MDKYEQLNQAIAELKDQPGALMPVLQRAQGIFGCVPMDVQKIIADGLGVTLSEVYGVATFYAQFSLEAAGKYTITFGASVEDPRGTGVYTVAKAQAWPVHNVLAPDMELK